MSTILRSRAAGVVLTTAIVGLALTAGYIHLGLGGFLFTMNGLGYLGLAAIFAIGATVSHPIVRTFSWAPRVMMGGYAALTISAYLVMGPYFTLGWITKGIEVALIALVAVDATRVYGSPVAMVRTAFASVFGRSDSQSA